MTSLAPSGQEWERLLRHLDLAEGFTLLFLICPSTQHAEAAAGECAAQLRVEDRSLETVPPAGVAELRDLAHRLLQPPQTPQANVLWVSLYPAQIKTDADFAAETDAWTAALSQGLAGLNQNRNLFARAQDRPVILAGTHQLLTICPRVAPDLWSIRSSVIRLPADSAKHEPGAAAFQSPEPAAGEPRGLLRAPAAGLADAQRAREAIAKLRGRAGTELDQLRYLIRAAGALEGRGHLAEQNEVLRDALRLAESENLPGSPVEQATLLNDLAALLFNLARHHEAEPLFRRALALDETGLGPQHQRVAIRLNNLANLLQATNRLGEAEPLFRRALAITEKSHGLEHPNVGIYLNNLANLLKDTDRLAEAEPHFRRALAIDEKVYGRDHPAVATDLNNLAILLRATNRLAEAEPLFRRALAITEKSHGPEHPNVAICLSNLANLLQATNRLAEAEPLLRRGLAIDEKSLGPEHPDVAIRLNNLALLLQDTNRLAEAEPLFRRGIFILVRFQQQTGHEHPNFHRGIQNYLTALTELGLSEAEAELKVNGVIEEGRAVGERKGEGAAQGAQGGLEDEK